MHESSLYEANCFLTLTYRDEQLPPDNSLLISDHQLFMKRLRKSLHHKIRFYNCGEYGDETNRPHYHTILFNHEFPDLKFLKYTKTEQPLFTSQILDDLWSHGDCYVGSVTFESAAYCGRYCMKKLTGHRKSEYGSREPEFSNQSRRPGIGKPWLDKWQTDVYPNDFCVFNGKKVKPPKFYDQHMILQDGPTGQWIKDDTGHPIYWPHVKLTESDKRTGSRIRNAKKHSSDNTKERLAVREEVHLAKISQLTRK